MLYSNERLLPANVEVDHGFREVLAQSELSFDLYTEFLDAIRFPGPEREEEMARYLAGRYRDGMPEVLVAGGPQALAFLLAGRETLFPGIPLVYVGAEVSEEDARNLPPGVLGVPIRLPVTETMKVVLSLRPPMRNVVVISDTSLLGKQWEARCRREFALFEDQAEFQYWGDRSLNQLLEEVARLPKGTAIFYTVYFKEPSGTNHLPAEVAEKLAAHSSVPIFSVYDTYLSRGITGGVMSKFRDEGRACAELVLRTLRDGQVAQEPVQVITSKRPYFNAAALERHHIQESSLPSEAIILGRKPSILREHPLAVLGGGTLIALQTSFIGTLLWLRKRALRGERELRLSEERFAKAFEARPSAIAIVRARDSVILDVNRVWGEQFGFSKEEVLGRTSLELELFVDAADRDRLSELMERERAVHGAELQLRKKCGQEIRARLYVEPISLNGEPCYIVVQHDITAQKQAEEARRQMEHVSRLTTVGELTATIAHEINQPLGAILTNAEAAEMYLDEAEAADSELRLMVTDIRDSAVRASEVMNGIRNLTRKQPSDRSNFDGNQMVREVVSLVQADAHRRKICVILQLEDALLPVNGAKVQLQQVILNLLLNAMEAMQDTPLPQREIRVSTISAGEKLRINIVDQGHGLPLGDADRIFESFYSTKRQGLGLGLTMAKTITEDHGGSLSARNNDGLGATFQVELPVAFRKGG